MRQLLIPAAGAAALLLATATPTHATWSICMTDSETGECAVGTVTCLTSFDLLAIVPVLVVGKGAAAVQSAGDFAGVRRPVIFKQLQLGTDPADILVILEGFNGHQQRQYGIADTQGRAITFSGTQNGAWAGGVIGTVGSMTYAVQGNVLAGSCVVAAIEDAIVNTPGDFPDKLMAGMEAARAMGGDGRCSCSSGDPPGCGCPVDGKSGHIGGVVTGRIGDIDDDVCNASGCVDGDYFLRLNVSFQTPGSEDPVRQLQTQYADWRADHVGRPDAVHSTVGFDPSAIPANGVTTTTMEIALLDWQDLPIDVELDSITVEHSKGSAGRSAIGAITDNGGGLVTVELTAGTEAGVDRFRIVVDDGIRPVTLMPDPRFEYFTLGDIDGDGVVAFGDLLIVLAEWGPCPEGCISDLDGSDVVDFADILIVLGNWD